MQWLWAYVRFWFHHGGFGGPFVLFWSAVFALIVCMGALLAVLQLVSATLRGSRAAGRAFSDGWRSGGSSSS